MTFVARLLVALYGLLFLGLLGVVLVNPARAERFLLAFGSSARAHYVEMAFRLGLGTSLLLAAPNMWRPRLFQVLGWAIVVSSVVLLLLPWQWHDRLGQRLRPALVRWMRVYAVGAFLFGGLLVYGVLSAGLPGGR